MAINKIRITNFKSFKDLKVELGKFNVLIGANASGKSNFVQIFEFLRDIIKSGLNNAISMQGGVEYLRNMNIGPSEDFSVNVVFGQDGLFLRGRTKEGSMGIKIYETILDFALKFKKRGLGFEISRDNLTHKCEFVTLEMKKKKFEVKDKLGEGEIIFSHTRGKVKMDLNKPEEVPIEIDAIFPPFLREEKLPPNTLIVESPFYFMAPARILGEFSIYDFDPKLPKKATIITGKAELEEDGSNLSIVLKNIIENKDKIRMLFNLVKDLLPFIDSLGVEKFADKSLLFKLREIYSGKQYLPASLASDGTINITALIVALYFERKPLIIIEEPERNIHPYLLSKLIDMMKDVSQRNQIIVTTHNPEIVKYAGLENILLVSRDKEGFSLIDRPADRDDVKMFLKNEIGIEELYIQNLLGV